MKPQIYLTSKCKKMKISTTLKLRQSWLMSFSPQSVITRLIQFLFFFYNRNYKYEEFNKKLTVSHTSEAKKALNST